MLQSMVSQRAGHIKQLNSHLSWNVSSQYETVAKWLVKISSLQSLGHRVPAKERWSFPGLAEIYPYIGILEFFWLLVAATRTQQIPPNWPT